MLLAAIYIFVYKNEVQRMGKERTIKVSECFFGKKGSVKCGDLHQYEEEFKSTVLIGLTSLAPVSSSNISDSLLDFTRYCLVLLR